MYSTFFFNFYFIFSFMFLVKKVWRTDTIAFPSYFVAHFNFLVSECNLKYHFVYFYFLLSQAHCSVQCKSLHKIQSPCSLDSETCGFLGNPEFLRNTCRLFLETRSFWVISSFSEVSEWRQSKSHHHTYRKSASSQLKGLCHETF